MTVKALDGGKYKVDIRPRGTSGRRIQRTFTKKADAVAFERYVISNMHDKEWLEKPRDHRRLSELFELWWVYAGRNNKYAGKRKTEITAIIKDMNDPMAFKLTKKFLSEYRSRRLFSGIKESTINRDMTHLSGMISALVDVGEFVGEHPFRAIKPLKEKIPEMSYLTTTEIEDLLSAVEGDAWRLTLLCLSTGGRWGEVTALRAEHMINNRVTFTKTKNGKTRTVPVSDEVMKAVKTKNSGLLFSVDYGDYRQILKTVKPDLPKGQAVHVLRHTFAAHFMINGGNILALQKIMGHSSIQQSMTYAHLAPDYLQDAILLNPLRGNIHISSTL